MFGKISRNRLIDRNSRMKPTPAIPQPASILGVFQRLAGLFEPFIHFNRFKNASDPSKAKCWVEKPFDDEQGQEPWLTACPALRCLRIPPRNPFWAYRRTSEEPIRQSFGVGCTDAAEHLRQGKTEMTEEITIDPDPTAKSNTDRSVAFTVAKIGKACGYVGRLGFLAELHSSANK